MEARVKRRRLNCKAFASVYSDVQRFSVENCGACLLPLIDDSENSFSELLLLAKTDLCDHLFHANCLKTWSTRDSSCPQCRLRFNHLGVYGISGKLEETKRVPQVFLGDLLDEEEEEEESESDGSLSAWEEERQPARRDAVSPAQETASPPRETASPALESKKRINRKLRAEVARMREQLASERRRELLEQRRIQERIDPDLVKVSVIRNLKRLPYQFKPRHGGEGASCKLYVNRTGKGACVQIQTEQNRMVVPRVAPVSEAKPSLAERFARLRNPPTYEQDFLLTQSKT